jgi:hypothetical protein
MRISQATLFLALVGSAQAFTTVAPFGVTSKDTSLLMAKKPDGPGSPMTNARKAIGTMTKENFSETLTKVEPFLVNDVGATFYTKSIKRIAVKAKAFGTEIPAGYAAASKATLKKREKQDAFIATKEEAKVAAEEEAKAAEEEAKAEAAAAVEAAAAAAAEAAAAPAAEEPAAPEEPADEAAPVEA